MLHFDAGEDARPPRCGAPWPRLEERMKIKSPKDFWAGAMFIAFGGFAVGWSLTHYQMGTAVRMGPGYFPTMLGGLLVVLGLAVLLFSLATEGEGVPKFHFRPLLLISLGCLAY